MSKPDANAVGRRSGHDPSNHAEVFHQALNVWTDRWIAEAFEAVCAASDTNDTKSMAGDIGPILKAGRTPVVGSHQTKERTRCARLLPPLLLPVL